MLNEDFYPLSRLSRAFWSDRALSDRQSAETLSAVTLLDLPDDSLIDKYAKGLLEKAIRIGPSANASVLDHPFYRLIPEERLVLSALHFQNWSYERLSRILGLNTEQVTSLAWNARLRIAASRPTAYNYAHGPKKMGTHCPDYDTQSPWTQKFLDEELSKREQLFLQNHMMGCEGCRKALISCRNLYYAVEAILPLPKSDVEVAQSSDLLHRLWFKTAGAAQTRELTVKETLSRFFSRKEVWLPLLLLAVILYCASRLWG